MIMLMLKTVHVIAVAVFIGAIVAALFWGSMARTRIRCEEIGLIFEGIHRSDALLIRSAVVGIVLTGIGMSWVARIPVWSIGWLLWPIVLIILVGVLANLRIGPLQSRLVRLCRQRPADDPPPAAFESVYRRWRSWTLLGLLLSLMAVVIMVAKWPLPAF